MIPSTGKNGLSRFESLSTRLAAADSIRERRLAAHLLGVLVVPQALVHGARRWPSCVHSANSTSATSSGSTQMTSSFRTFGIFGTWRTAESRVSSGRSLSSSFSISRSPKPGPDVARVHEVAASWTREHERAEAARAPALPLRVAGDQELLPVVRLDLQPVARAAAREVAGVGRFAMMPSSAAASPPRRARRRRRTSPRAARCGSAGRAAPRAACAARSTAGRPAARRRPRAGRRRSRRAASRLPCCIAEKLARPCVVERAHLAVEDAVRRLQRLLDLAGDPGEARGQVVAVAAVSVGLAAGDARSRGSRPT